MWHCQVRHHESQRSACAVGAGRGSGVKNTTTPTPLILRPHEIMHALTHGCGQFRRVVRPQPEYVQACYQGKGKPSKPGYSWPPSAPFWKTLEEHAKSCPFGTPGDRVWVKETWADVNTEDGPSIAYRADHSVRSWHSWSKSFGPDYGVGPSFDYDAYPGNYAMWWSDLFDGEPDHGWRSSTHHPQWASRLTLEITAVRGERVQEINNEGITAEGCPIDIETPGCLDGIWQPHRKIEAATWFADIFNSHAKPGEDFASNPFVWVGDYKVVDTDQTQGEME